MKWLLFLSVIISSNLFAQDTEQILDVNKSNIQAIRFQLENEVYGNESIPVYIKDSVDDSYLLWVKERYRAGNLRNVETGTITLKYGFKSKIYHFHPMRTNGLNIPVIYHSGHRYGTIDEDEQVNFFWGEAYHIRVIDYFLSKGFDVIGIDMPMTAQNTFPSAVEEDGKIIPMFGHDYFFYLENPFYYFMAPIKSVVNHLEAQGYKDFVMMGLSGGGWSTTLYSAMDTRIRYSFPVAGTIPVSLRTNPRDLGDLEQYYTPFYERFNYKTLYLLGAAGENRLQYQILLKYDHCCFSFDGNEYWTKDVQRKIKEESLGGDFQFYYDTIARTHRISTVSVDSIYNRIISTIGKERLKPTIEISSSRATNVICDNDTLTLTVPFATYNEVQWMIDTAESKGDTSFAIKAGKEGNFYARITNLSGTVIHSDTIYIDQQLLFTKPIIYNHNSSLRSSATQGNRWFRNGIEILNSGSMQIDNAKPGRYTVRQESGNCISDLSDPVDVGVSVFPNPATTVLTVRTESVFGRTNYVIARLDGVPVQRGTIPTNEKVILSSSLIGGIYILHLTGENGSRAAQKFRINR